MKRRMLKTAKEAIVLMADDDRDDCTIAKDAFEESGAKGGLMFVEDGVELMEYLCNSGYELEKCSFPKFILLDLNMPRKDGREALKELKASPDLRRIPVIVFTTSYEKKDKAYCLQMGANAFITKPDNFRDGGPQMEYR